MTRALIKGEGSEAASSRRRRQGREERLRERSMGRSRTSRSRTRRRLSRSSTRSRSRSCRWGRLQRSSSDEDQNQAEYKDLGRTRSRAKSCKSRDAFPGKSKDGIPDQRSSSSKSRFGSRRDGGSRIGKRSRSSSDSQSSPDTRRSSQERESWKRRKLTTKSSFRRTLYREVDVKREKCEVQTSPSPSPCPRYRSEKNGRDEDEGNPDALEYRSRVKTEPVSTDQSPAVQWNDNSELKDQEIQSKIEEIKIKKEIQSLSEERRIKDEELRLAREKVQSKEQEALSKEDLIQSQCEEISKLKFKLEKQVGEANTLRAGVELLKEKAEEKEKYLSILKITQESSTEELARLVGNVKSLEGQAVAHRENVNRVTVEKVALEENVNQLTVEKELVEMKSCKLQRLNENLRFQLEKEKEREIDLVKLGSFLDSGRAEIADMREELRWMKINSFARGRGAANTDVELVKMKESLNHLKAENETLKTSWPMVMSENATLRKELQELQQVEHRLRWEVGTLKTELSNVKKENNNNVRGQNNNNNTREQVPASGCTGWCQTQTPPMVGAAPQSGPPLHHVATLLETGIVKRDIE